MCTTAGHTDFVKSLLVIPHLQLLVSGSSDKTICVWSLQELVSALSHDRSASDTAIPPLKRLQVVKSHTRPVECFALLVRQADEDESGGNVADTSTVVYSGDSMGVIRSWTVSLPSSENTASVVLKESATYPGHHTAITKLILDGAQGLISSSVDSQILYHSIETMPHSLPPLLIPHPPYPETTSVRSLLLLPSFVSEYSSQVGGMTLLLSGASDEDIRVLDISATAEYAQEHKGKQHSAPDHGAAAARDVSRIKGHWADVMDMDIWVRRPEGHGARPQLVVVSASLDETLRKWSIAGESSRAIPRPFQMSFSWSFGRPLEPSTGTRRASHSQGREHDDRRRGKGTGRAHGQRH